MIEDFVYLGAKLGVESFRKARPGRSKTDARTTTPVLHDNGPRFLEPRRRSAGRNSPSLATSLIQELYPLHNGAEIPGR